MLKIITYLLTGLDLIVGGLCTFCLMMAVAGNTDGVLLPGGLLVSLPAICLMLLLVELLLVAATFIVKRIIKNQAGDLPPG